MSGGEEKCSLHGDRLWLLFEVPTLSIPGASSSLNTPPALLNNQPSSILRLSYSSRGVKDVYRCFCFILRSLLQPQYIKHLRRPHCCRLPGPARLSYGPCLRRPQALSTSGQLLISPLFCNAPTFICNALLQTKRCFFSNPAAVQNVLPIQLQIPDPIQISYPGNNRLVVNE